MNFDLERILILILIPDCRRFFLKLTAAQVECVCRRSEGFTFLERVTKIFFPTSKFDQLIDLDA